MWLVRANKADAEGSCRYGKNCRAAEKDCSGSGASVRGDEILGLALDRDPLF